MSAVKQLGWAEALAAIITCFQAKQIPCLVGQSGRGKSALVKQAANLIGQSAFGEDMPNWFNKPDDWDKGVLIEYNLATESPEDINGLYDVNAMQNEGVTRRIPDERLVYARKHPSIIFFDEADRGRPEIWGAVCAGLAANPMAIGGVEIGTSRAIFAINGETDMGTVEMPEAIRQRVVFIYIRPSQGEWLNYQRGVTSLPDGILHLLDGANEARCQSWTPTDLAGDAQAFERSATKFCKLLECYYGLRKRGDYANVNADLVLDALGIGQLGTDYWYHNAASTLTGKIGSPRDAAFAGANLADMRLNASEIASDPENADLPPEGMWVQAIEALEILCDVKHLIESSDNWIKVYSSRFPEEGKAALDRAGHTSKSETK